MLVLGRRVGEVVRISLADGVSPQTTIGDLFRSGPIELVVTRITGKEVKIGIEADPRFKILRAELVGKEFKPGPKSDDS